MLLLLEAYAPTAVYRISGGKRVAAYTIDDSGRIRRKIDAFLELERRQDEEDQAMIDAILVYWTKRE